MTLTKPGRGMLDNLDLTLGDLTSILASQAQAEAGSGSGLMNATRVGQAIAALGSGFSWSNFAAFYTTGRVSPELRTTIPISSTTRYPVVRLGPIPLTHNDLILVTASAQFTTDETVYNTMIMTQIILTNDPQAYDPVGPSREVTDINGSNVTPSIHHDSHAKTGFFRPPVTENAYLIYVARCDSSSGIKPINVDQDYAWMDCIVLKNFFA